MALEEKERALRLMEYPVILQNAEHYKRPLINSVVAELASFGVTLNVPKLHTLTRTQVRALAKQIDEMGEYPLTKFADKHQADIAVVSKHFADTNAANAVDFSEVTPAIYDWKKGNAIEILTKLAGNTAAPNGVRASAQRLATAMSVAPSKAFEELRNIFVEGLDKLEPEHVPFEWFTMARPNS
jgi:hypothetical protein